MAGTFTVTGMSSSEPAGQRTFGPISIQGRVVVGETLSTPLSSGDNSFLVPAGAIAVWIIPPATLQAVTVMSVRSDVDVNAASGIQWNSALPFGPWPLPAGATLVIINAAGDVLSPTTLAFI